MSRAKYNQEQLDDLTAKASRETIKAINQATDEEIAAGKGWYPVAREWARLVGEAAGWKGERAVDRGAAAIGVLSPRVKWAQNLDDAMAIAQDDFDWQPRAFGTNIKKAMVILAHDVSDSEAEEEIRGQKVRAFVDNIRRPLWSQAIVLDTWMCKLFDVPAKDLELKGVYEALAEGIRAAADAVDLKPSQAQAIAWVATRGPEKEDIVQ